MLVVWSFSDGLFGRFSLILALIEAVLLLRLSIGWSLWSVSILPGNTQGLDRLHQAPTHSLSKRVEFVTKTFVRETVSTNAAFGVLDDGLDTIEYRLAILGTQRLHVRPQTTVVRPVKVLAGQLVDAFAKNSRHRI